MDARWQARRLLDSPHRLGFAAAAAVMAVSAIGWLALLLWPMSSANAALPPASIAHALAIVFGFMPLFFAGFLFTVGPRWLGQTMDDSRYAMLARRVRAPLAGYALAWIAWWPAWLLAAAGGGAGPTARAVAALPAALLLIAATAWTAIVAQLLRLLADAGRQPEAETSSQLRAAALACAAGAVLLWAAGFAAARGEARALHAIATAALWIFCGGVFASASHRMLPLDAMADRPALEARHPLWLLALMGGTLALQALDAVAAAARWPLPAAWHALQALGAAGAVALLAPIAWRWARRQRLGWQLPAMLHAGFVWLVVAIALQAMAHAMAAAGRPGALGAAPVHALALGWMGSTIFAMASRVAGAFGGQAQAANRVAWRLFALVQAAALARVASALWPDIAGWLTPWAAAAFAVAAVGWLAVYGRWLGLPRRGGGGAR
ncbi:MAG: NnrS family protein [Burkholderiales bacterium]|nr:NnrS family protein [Burkholderiales bacterium]